MRKALFNIGEYQVYEGPTGGWRVKVLGAADVLSVHETRQEASAAAKRYAEADKRRAA